MDVDPRGIKIASRFQGSSRNNNPEKKKRRARINLCAKEGSACPDVEFYFLWQAEKFWEREEEGGKKDEGANDEGKEQKPGKQGWRRRGGRSGYSVSISTRGQP